jgi:hypothetical protein
MNPKGGQDIMRNHLGRATAFLTMTLFLAAPVFAQDDNKVINEEYGVEIERPKDWKISAGNEKAVAVFQHPSTQSQIEIVPTKLMTPDVANVFFDTFHKTLAESSFEKESEKDEKIGNFEGKSTTYKFTHAGVTLEVHIFQFVRESTAWLAVGYLQAQSNEIEKLRKSYRKTIEKTGFTATQ